MIGLDTNVLVRYIMQDDADQLARVVRLFESELTIDNPGFISLVVLAETVWVLRSRYGIDRAGIARVVRACIESRQLRVERVDCVVCALRRFHTNAVDFSDALIVEVARAQGCTQIVSFDRKMAALGVRMM